MPLLEIFDQIISQNIIDQAFSRKVALSRLIAPTITFSLKPSLKRLAFKQFFEKA
jgi:hypothetical protein